ncbi:hypothetical protein GCM10028819_23620 [Spirosoma humi]
MIRRFDWATTSLGTPDTWPSSLRTAVSNLLQVPIPALVLWGDEQICFYNDTARASLKPTTHPAVGQSVQALWTPAWNPIRPLLDQVLETGQPATSPDTPLTIYQNDTTQTVYWTLSLSRLLDDQSQPSGVLILAVDVTQSVLDRQRLESEKQQADRQLRLYKTIASSTPDLMYVFDLNYRFTYANKALLDMWGSSWEKSIGKGLLENGYEPWHAQMHEREIDQVVVTRQPIRGEVSFPHATLGRRVYDYVFAPVFNEQGEVEAIAGTTRDITDSKQVLLRTEESKRQLLTLFEQSPVGLATISANDKLVFQWANTFYGELVARPPQDIVGKPLLEALPELKGQGFDELLKNVIATGTPYVAPEVAVGILRDGHLTTIYVNLTYQPQKGSQGDIEAILVVATDVTQQVMTRKQIEESESKLRAILATAPAGIGVFVGRDLVIENPNQTFIDIVGKGPHIDGLPLREAMPELITEGQAFLQILDDVYTTGKPFISPSSLVKIVQNGVLTDNYYNISYSPIRNAAGEIYAILDIAIDVTQEVKHRQQLEETEVSLREAVELAQLGTWSIDVASQGLIFSDRLIEWFGYDPKDRSYQEIIHLLDVDDQQRVDQAIAWALNPESDGIYNEIYTVIHPHKGQKRILHMRGRTVFDAARKAVRLNGTAQDITLQREMQLALEQQIQLRTEELAAINEELSSTNEELAANNEEYAAINEELEEANTLLARSNDNLQQFAYVASHDLQEPLRKIQQFGDLLKTRYTEASGQELLYLDRMQSAAARMSALIKDLLNYSRITTQRDTSSRVALSQVVDEVLIDLDLLREETKARVEIDPLPVIEGDAGQLGQLFQNLLSNALKFRRPDVHPHIQIKVDQVSSDQLPPWVKPSRAAQSYYKIDVVDNGIGFDEKYLDRIFQVFQRLHGKSEFSGTGIGLAICEKVAANHGGAITATSQLGQGATFSVYLPA